MNILILNCGSSSLKYQLIEMPSESVIAGGEAQRVGPVTAEPSCIFHQVKDRRERLDVRMNDHKSAFEEIFRLFQNEIKMPIHAIGHRVVHGGEFLRRPTVVDPETIAILKDCQSLAPLHNPRTVEVIEACRERYPELPQVAVFDTAFHSTIPEYARTYALPGKLREELGIRKYGFHGTSHQFVAEEASSYLGIRMRDLNAVSCHLGSGGASLCAIVGGKSVDNTMGYSPLQGLIMSTRCGDLDPALILRSLHRSNGNGGSTEELLNRGSGILGLSGFSADIRDILSSKKNSGNPESKKLARAELTAQLYLWRIRKYLGAYLAVVKEPHAIIFTDTVGESEAEVRRAVCAGMNFFGVEIDANRNSEASSLPADVATPRSRVRILVVHTNEELAIARCTARALG